MIDQIRQEEGGLAQTAQLLLEAIAGQGLGMGRHQGRAGVDLYPMALVVIADQPQGLTDIPIDRQAEGAAVMGLGSVETLLP